MSAAELAAVAAGLATLVAIVTGMRVFSTEERRMRSRTAALERSFSVEGVGPLRTPVLRDRSHSGSARANAILSRFRWTTRTAALLERADLPLKVSEYLLLLIAAFAIPGMLAWLASGLPLVGLGFAIGGGLTMHVWTGSRARRRLNTFNKQLAPALHLMSTSLRSGFSIMDSARTVAREIERPLSTEFERLLDETRVGGSFEDSLNRMVTRVQSEDLRIVARALDIHRRVGGDLAAILDSVAQTMREREELRGHILALTAQQRFGGIIVGLLPIWVVGFLSVTNVEFISPLWEETAGRWMLAAGTTAEIVAFFIMRRVLRIEV